MGVWSWKKTLEVLQLSLPMQSLFYSPPPKAACLSTKRITAESTLMNTCEEATPVKDEAECCNFRVQKGNSV